MREAARSPRPAPDARPLPSREHPAAPAREEKRAKPLNALRTPEPLLPRPQDRPRRLAIPLPYPLCCAPRCPLPHPARAFLPPPSPSELGTPIPAPAPSARRHPFATAPARRLRPFAPTAPPRIASSPPAGACHAPRTSRAPTPLFRLPPASCYPNRLRPPLPTSDPLRSPPVPHRPITGKRRPNHEQVNAHFVCVSDAHARKKRGSVLRYPSSFPVLSVKPQRVNPASPSVRSVPTPLPPTASRQRPP